MIERDLDTLMRQVADLYQKIGHLETLPDALHTEILDDLVLIVEEIDRLKRTTSR